ncbi:flavin monoamine oxidase family protein [Streptomyces sp. NPDC101225]|uniref:flavin monoamine oxidase family protein n=1 Tax=Streptomyces sp. NPDC101225 TaxID=3366135 RepID=UPI00381C8DA6
MHHTEISRPRGPRRVIVVGGGPSGLAAARELERAGHRVTVLEEQDTVAGKCRSLEIGGLAHDLGGHICTNRYERTAQLMDELGVRTERTTRYRVLDVERRTASRQAMSFLRDPAFRRYRTLREREFSRIAEPGLAHSARALAAPVADWLAEHRLQSMAASFGPGFTAAGYGYLDDDVPALYFVKYAEMTGLLSPGPELLGHEGSFTVAGGFATLWRRVAAELRDVRCGVRVTSVERHADGVRVRTDSGPLAADELVLAVAPDRVLPALDATDRERDLAGRVRSNAYHTTVATASGLPGDAFYFLAPTPRTVRRGATASRTTTATRTATYGPSTPTAAPRTSPRCCGRTWPGSAGASRRCTCTSRGRSCRTSAATTSGTAPWTASTRSRAGPAPGTPAACPPSSWSSAPSPTPRTSSAATSRRSRAH